MHHRSLRFLAGPSNALEAGLFDVGTGDNLGDRRTWEDSGAGDPLSSSESAGGFSEKGLGTGTSKRVAGPEVVSWEVPGVGGCSCTTGICEDGIGGGGMVDEGVPEIFAGSESNSVIR
jgi:hypothetical protein